MINNGNDIGFIHDLSSLDKLRQKAVDNNDEHQKEALTAAAKQFEAIFTSMLFKSMRDANATFESGLMDSQNQQFYRQMTDEQMASELSASGSLGLADMIVAQLASNQNAEKSIQSKDADFEAIMEKIDRARTVNNNLPQQPVNAKEISEPLKEMEFDSPESFVMSMKPYAEKAARALGVDSSLILAQAALETGWGQKMVSKGEQNSNNLFNIKAGNTWKGEKVRTQTLEYHDGVPVRESAAFRSYSSYAQSFDDYVRFLTENPRYSNALAHGGDNENFIRGIHKAGYATDPNYADKILTVKEKIDTM